MPDGLETTNPSTEETADKKDIFDQVIQAISNPEMGKTEELIKSFASVMEEIDEKYVGLQKSIQGAEHHVLVDDFVNIVHGSIDPSILVKVKGVTVNITYKGFFEQKDNSENKRFFSELIDTIRVLQKFYTSNESAANPITLYLGNILDDAVYPKKENMNTQNKIDANYYMWKLIIPHVIAHRIQYFTLC